MNFDNPLFLIPALTDPILVIAGIVMVKLPPAKINGLYGYRTHSSMKSQERWDLSQKYSARELIKIGIILALTSILGLVYTSRENIGVLIGLGLMLIAIMLFLIRTEKAIKVRFGKE